MAQGHFKRIHAPGAIGTALNDINDHGRIVGSAFKSPGEVQAFVLSKGAYATYEAPGAPFTFLEDINNRGQVAGSTYADNLTLSGARGFLLPKGIEGLLKRVDLPGAPRTIAHGLDDQGRIVGTYENPDATLTSARGPAATDPHGPARSGVADGRALSISPPSAASVLGGLLGR